MTDVKRLLDEATSLPWVVQIPGDNDPGAGTVFIDTHAYKEGPEPVVAETFPLGAKDAALIVHAVNTLPAYEAAVDALDRLGAQHHALSDHNPATVFVMRPAFEGLEGLAECDDYTCIEARAALRAVRDES